MLRNEAPGYFPEYHIIATAVEAFFKILIAKSKIPLSVSDIISAIGLLTVFPELSSSAHKISLIQLWIAFGTAIDDLSDEGPEVFSKGMDSNNLQIFENFLMILTNIIGNMTETQWVEEIKQYFIDVYSAEQYAHSLCADQNFTIEQQLEYRELVNVIWAIIYNKLANIICALSDQESQALAMLIDNIQISEQPEELTILPTYSDFENTPSLNSQTYKELISRYQSIIDNSDAEITLLLLYYLVMECSNWYDTILNTDINSPDTPVIKKHQVKYREQLDQLGFPTWLTIVSFLTMFCLIQIRRGFKKDNLNRFLEALSGIRASVEIN